MSDINDNFAALNTDKAETTALPAKATEAVYGLSKLSAAPASASAPIAVGDNDSRLPTSDQKAALAGTGTPNSSNKYVTNDDTGTSGNSKVLRLASDGKLPVLDGSALTAVTALDITGVIKMYGGASAPTGYLLCDGSAVSRSTYSALFAIIASTYGNGDASTTFNIPDLRGRVPIGVGTGIGGGAAGTGLPVGGNALTARVRGAWLGEETHALSTAELAAHGHGVKVGTATGAYSVQITDATTTTTGNNGVTYTTENAGSGTAHNVIQPTMCVNFIIKI